ncbi:hypothetical protein J6590_048128 [Homalodisca vitripennis]|nr:hypothetical protein J6590_048128 [Homalodisca vitripennis]
MPFDDQVWGIHNVDIWVNGGWKLLGKTNFTKGCSDTTEAFPEFFGLFEAYNITLCPVPKGRYNLKDFTLKELRMSKFPKLPYSRYRDTVVAYRTGKRVGCVIVTFNISSRTH